VQRSSGDDFSVVAARCTLGKIVEKLELMAFEPSGVTGDKEFPLVKSLPDYIAKWLRSRWLAKEPCK